MRLPKWDRAVPCWDEHSSAELRLQQGASWGRGTAGLLEKILCNHALAFGSAMGSKALCTPPARRAGEEGGWGDSKNCQQKRIQFFLTERHRDAKARATEALKQKNTLFHNKRDHHWLPHVGIPSVQHRAKVLVGLDSAFDAFSMSSPHGGRGGRCESTATCIKLEKNSRLVCWQRECQAL